MHRPERWGFVTFGDEPHRDPSAPHNELRVRETLMEVYHRQRAFKQAHKRWATSLYELGLNDSDVTLKPDNDGWSATTSSNGYTFHVNSTSRLWEE